MPGLRALGNVALFPLTLTLSRRERGLSGAAFPPLPFFRACTVFSLSRGEGTVRCGFSSSPFFRACTVFLLSRGRGDCPVRLFLLFLSSGPAPFSPLPGERGLSGSAFPPLLSSGPAPFSPSPGERGLSGAAFPPLPFFRACTVFPLSLWERAGVRGKTVLAQPFNNLQAIPCAKKITRTYRRLPGFGFRGAAPRQSVAGIIKGPAKRPLNPAACGAADETAAHLAGGTLRSGGLPPHPDPFPEGEETIRANAQALLQQGNSLASPRRYPAPRR